jgi:hypothetical protein
MDILVLIESFLGPLDTTFGKLVISIFFMAFIGIGLGLVGVPKLTLLISILVTLFMFISFGWIPVWIVILLAIGLFALLYTNIAGGNRNNV